MPAPPPPDLTSDDLRRYARHLVLPDVGPDGQRRLKASRVLVVGVGGLGSPAALYLAAAGVGTIGLADDDVVHLSNLQRQVLHGSSAVGRPKLASAAARLGDLNPSVRLILHEGRLTSADAIGILAGYDVVVDGSDNLATRYLTNDACALLGRPLVFGAVHRFEGQASVFWPPRGPCYRCLYREPPPPHLVPTCEQAGVLGVLPGIIGSVQAAEVIKLLLGLGEPLVGRLLVLDALRARFREIEVPRDPACPLCGERPVITGLADYEVFCGTAAAVPGGEWPPLEIDARSLDAERRAGQGPMILDVREPFEWGICRIEESVLVPLSDLPSRVGGLPADAEVVTVCHTGQRSLVAARFLREAGMRRARSLSGGLEAWALEVDPGMARY